MVVIIAENFEHLIKELDVLCGWLDESANNEAEVRKIIADLKHLSLSIQKKQQIRHMLSQEMLFHVKWLGDVYVPNFPEDGTRYSWWNYLSRLCELSQKTLERAIQVEKTEYIKVFMEYESDDIPVIYLYEVDLENGRLALRAIEIFLNRQVNSIENLYRDVIEIVPVPTVKGFNSKVWGDGFCASIIAKKEFEKIWNNSSYNGELFVK